MKPRIPQKHPKHCSLQAWQNLYGKMMRRRYSFIKSWIKKPRVMFLVKPAELGRDWKGLEKPIHLDYFSEGTMAWTKEQTFNFVKK